MTELAALRDLGRRLRDVGAVPGTTPTRKPVTAHDVATGVERLRALVAGAAGCGDQTAEPEMTPAQLAQWIARYKPDNAQRALGRSSGWGADVGGQPYCGGCKAFLPHPGALCKVCGFMDGGGYVGVPAKTSHLERWR